MAFGSNAQTLEPHVVSRQRIGIDAAFDFVIVAITG